MKTWTSSLPMIAIAAAAALNVVACNDDPQKAKQTADEIAVKENGIQKPMTLASAVTLETLPDGLYRLTEVRMQADFTVAKTDKLPETKVSLALAQPFKRSPRSREKFDAVLGDARKGISSNHPERGDIDLTLAPQFKVPLTIRVHQGEVTFEQIRSFWICLRNKGQCPRQSYLSAGTSTAAGVIHPAQYLVTKGLASHGADAGTQIQSMLTGGNDTSAWIEIQSALATAGASPLTVHLGFERDSREYPQDRQENSDEESLRTGEPTP